MPIYGKNCLIRRQCVYAYKMVKLQPIDKCPSNTIDAKMQNNKANVNKHYAVFIKVGLM